MRKNNTVRGEQTVPKVTTNFSACVARAAPLRDRCGVWKAVGATQQNQVPYGSLSRSEGGRYGIGKARFFGKRGLVVPGGAKYA